MNKVSIIIPARHELYLNRTIEELFKQARGDIEIILVLDGYWPDEMPKDDPRLIIIHRERLGMRAAINAGVSIAKGKYLMKVDAHCAFAEGYDLSLQADCDVDWLVVPRRYSLNVETWAPNPERPIVDYEYIHFPEIDSTGYMGLHARAWKQRGIDRRDTEIDENMSFQGSCWFMPRRYFMDLCFPLDEGNYGMFVGEPQEIGLKVWLSGGKNMSNKKTWYAHLWKGQGYRTLFLEQKGFKYTRVGNNDLKKGQAYSTNFWFLNQWQERKNDLAWLVERFWPVPSWPEDRELWTRFPG